MIYVLPLWRCLFRIIICPDYII
ncbi:hypothetical protein Zm00014a_032336 [Zea mays]|uniref:Uncharacterized protein n=1 Tax=Zea mays TaxID=4577 RepID=A0A3L6FSI8_MAIZE|nr:hypothetical protein Zm00014a_032336 [Zea mays]